MRPYRPATRRWTRGAWLALILAGCVAPAWGDVPEGALVLVLKKVSDTHVRPVTGVVLGDDGRVLVPAGFVAAGDELLVLDGGSDLERHARPARTVGRSVAHGLAVLQVEGLARPAATVTTDPPRVGAALTFSAFPPAEQLAEGAARQRHQVRLLSGPSGALRPDPPLAQLDGPLFNRCGQLAGWHLAPVPPGRVPDPGATVVLADTLAAGLAAMQAAHELAPCEHAAAAPPGPRPAARPVAPGSELEILGATGEQDPPSAPAPAGAPADAPGHTASLPEMRPAASIEEQPDPLPAAPSPRPIAAPAERLDGAWLAGLALATLMVYLAVRRRSLVASKAEPSPVHPWPPLHLEVQLDPAGRCLSPQAVAPGRSRLLLGRAGTDFNIDHPTLEARHARLEPAGARLAVTDLGSSHGTRVNGVPCLEGETLLLEAGDELRLGGVRLRVGAGDAPGDAA